MKTNHTGSIQLAGLLLIGIFAVLTSVFLYRYYRDIGRYQTDPLHKALAMHSPVPAARARRRQLPFLRFPRYSIWGQLGHRRILYKEFPPYPQWAEEQGIIGRVRLAIRVSDTGEVYPNVWVTQTIGHPDMDDAAIQAIKHWKFAPLTRPQMTADPADLFHEPTPGESGVVNFSFSLSNQPIRL